MSEERIIKGIWIPIEIWKDAALSWNEKILLLEVDSYTSREQDCYFSDDYIADLLGVGVTTANKILASLIKKGYISKTRFDGRRRYIQSNLRLVIDGCSLAQNNGADLAENAGQPCTKVQPSNSNNNISNIQDNRINTSNKYSTIPLPFNSEAFVSTWYLLCQQPKWRKKSRAALEMNAKMLGEYSEAVAIKMMQNSIRNDWQGLFALKAEDVKAQQEKLIHAVGRVHASVLRQAKELGWTREEVAACGPAYAEEWDKYQDLI